MARRAFGNKNFAKAVKPPRVKGAGTYHAPRVLSPKQFQSKGQGFRNITQIGATRMTQTSAGAKFSVTGAGYRFNSAGRITHRTNIGGKRR